MNPKQKAIELYELCYYKTDSNISEHSRDRIAKTYAYLIVSEVQNQAENWGVISVKSYWKNVKHEISII